MARPLQLEFAGIFYHITSRADRRQAIYETDADRQVAGSGTQVPLLAMSWLLLGGQAYAFNDMQRFAKPYCRSGPGRSKSGRGCRAFNRQFSGQIAGFFEHSILHGITTHDEK